jgi:hypothetical protein
MHMVFAAKYSLLAVFSTLVKKRAFSRENGCHAAVKLFKEN